MFTTTYSPFHDFKPQLSPERLNSPSTAFEKTSNGTNSLAHYFNFAKVLRTINLLLQCLENFKTEQTI